MAAVHKNIGGRTWGLIAETFGIVVKDFKQKSDSEIFRHKDEQGETEAKTFYDFKTGGTVTGATTSAVDEEIGDGISLANEHSTLGGVTGGTSLIHSVEISRSNEAAEEMTLEWERVATLTVS